MRRDFARYARSFTRPRSPAARDGSGVRGLFDRFRDDPPAACRCEPAFEGNTLVLDAVDCPGGGRLTAVAACRQTAVAALRDRDADALLVRGPGVERRYGSAATALFVAAGRFAERVTDRDARLATYATEDPLAAAFDAAGRAGAVADVAAEAGLVATADAVGSYDDVGVVSGLPTAWTRRDPDPPAGAVLTDTRELPTGATVRVYATDRVAEGGDETPTYHLDPPESALADGEYALLGRATALLADGVGGGERAPRRALRRVIDDPDVVERLAPILRKHTLGDGVLEDLFADERVTDVYATAPVDGSLLRLRVDDVPHRSNVSLTEAGAAALASRFRASSGRPFSRAAPALDAETTVAGRRIRVAGVASPLSEGYGFALRAHGRHTFRLADLVGSGTLTPAVAGFLSLAVERGCACLVAGTRGAGKTTLLGALLWELPAASRTLVLEDTPELPVAALREAGRDVQGLRTTVDDGHGSAVDPASALRTGLRLGESALVVGEVRGPEARVLYEAMRVGAGGEAVLGTIHGDGGAGVRERVVSDLGVPATSFAVTDLVVTVRREGGVRRVARVEEVTADGFAPLFDTGPDGPEPTDRIEDGESVVVAGFAGPSERYADVRDALAARTARFERAGGA